jgi:hypothetical protein
MWQRRRVEVSRRLAKDAVIYLLWRAKLILRPQDRSGNAIKLMRS